MSDNSPKDIVVKYKVDSSCEIPSKNNDFCKEVVAGTEYGFDVSITAVSCPADKTEWGKKQQYDTHFKMLIKFHIISNNNNISIICTLAHEITLKFWVIIIYPFFQIHNQCARSR